MVKRFWLFIALSLLVILPTFAQAQDTDWQVLVYADNSILRVTADGLADPIALPEVAQNFAKGQTVFNVALSPDEHYFLFVDEIDPINYSAQLNIADLTTEDCCTVIPAPEGENWEVINLLGWSPDGREIVVNFLKAYTNEFDSLLAILNIETGEYRTFFDPTETEIMSNAIFFIDWTDDGIEIKQSCFPCGASADGQTMLWNPETNEITSNYSFNASAWGDRLANGEIIMPVQDPNYPISDADSMFDPANIIEYFHTDDSENREMIYFDAENIHLINPQWVIDGQAYVIQDATAEFVTLVWRDGHTQVVEFENQQVFFKGTPDGWLMTDTAGGRLFQYQWDGEAIEETDLGVYPVLRLLSTPELGATITEAIVPVIDNDV